MSNTRTTSPRCSGVLRESGTSEPAGNVNRQRERGQHMSTQTTVAKKVLHDKIEAQSSTVQAKLETLTAQAQTAKANAELKAIADHVAEKRAIDQKLGALKASGEAAYDKAKAEVESRVAQLEKSVQALESKLKSA